MLTSDLGHACRVSILMAQVGNRVARRLPARYLQWIFIAVMFYILLKMIGIFNWLGWPI
jgi:uncharacterized membrane protein YfcA